MKQYPKYLKCVNKRIGPLGFVPVLLKIVFSRSGVDEYKYLKLAVKKNNSLNKFDFKKINSTFSNSLWLIFSKQKIKTVFFLIF